MRRQTGRRVEITTGDARLDAALKRAEKRPGSPARGAPAGWRRHKARAVCKAATARCWRRQRQGQQRLEQAGAGHRGSSGLPNSSTAGDVHRRVPRRWTVAIARLSLRRRWRKPSSPQQGNKPLRRRRGGLTLCLQSSIPISYVELMNRCGRADPRGKAVLLAMGLLFLVGGAGGLPFGGRRDRWTP